MRRPVASANFEKNMVATVGRTPTNDRGGRRRRGRGRDQAAHRATAANEGGARALRRKLIARRSAASPPGTACGQSATTRWPGDRNERARERGCDPSAVGGAVLAADLGVGLEVREPSDAPTFLCTSGRRHAANAVASS